MEELLFTLLGFALVAAFVGCTIVLPIVAFLRTRRLAARLQQLEQLLAQAPAERPAAADSGGAIAELQGRIEQLERAVQGLPRPAAETVAPAEPPAAPRPSARPRRRRAEEPVWALPAEPRPGRATAVSLESWIGGHALGWVAVLLLLFAAGFFLKYAFENEWIGELGRVAIGVVAGAGLCVAGFIYHRRGWWLFSQMLTAGGVVLLYLATFGAFGYYHLIPRHMAAAYLVLLVLEAALLAVFYEAPAIAIMAVVGGLLTPVLLHTDHDQYRSLFTYLLVLNAGVVILGVLRHWRVLASVALLGTQLLFWLWFGEHYHPEKLAAALGFQAGVFGLFLAYNVVTNVLRRRNATVEDLVLVVVNAGLVAAAGYVLLDEDYHQWLGTLAIGLALVYAAVAWLVQTRRPDDARLLLALVATALGCVAAAIPLQAEAAWIAVGWAAQGAALWWFGLRVRSRTLHALGAALLLLAVGRLLTVDTPYTGREPFVPFFNKYAIPALLVAACVFATEAASRRLPGWFGAADWGVTLVVGLAGIILVWTVLSVETYTYFLSRIPTAAGDTSHLYRTAQMALSIVWAAYAALVLGAGFRFRSQPLRWTALALFGLTLAKVVLVDMAGLPGLYRVAAFFVLSLMMAGAAWGYQRVQRTRAAAGREVATHDAV